MLTRDIFTDMTMSESHFFIAYQLARFRDFRYTHLQSFCQGQIRKPLQVKIFSFMSSLCINVFINVSEECIGTLSSVSPLIAYLAGITKSPLIIVKSWCRTNWLHIVLSIAACYRSTHLRSSCKGLLTFDVFHKLFIGDYVTRSGSASPNPFEKANTNHVIILKSALLLILPLDKISAMPIANRIDA